MSFRISESRAKRLRGRDRPRHRRRHDPGAERAAEGNAARPRGRHRRAHGAADRRRAGRRHRHRRGRDPAQRRAEPRRAAAAATRCGNRAERRTGLGVRRAAARRQPRPDAGADRRAARGLVVGGLDHASKRSRSTRSIASRSCAARRRVFTAPTRLAASCRYSRSGRRVRRGDDLHAQRLRRLRHLQHGGRVGADSAGDEWVAALFAAGRRPQQRRLQCDRQSGQLQLQPRSRRVLHTRTCRPTSNWTWAAGQELAAQYFGNRLEQPVRRRRALFRRSHDHDGAGVERRRAATGSTTRGRRWSRPGKAATIPCRRPASATSPFKTTQRQYLWQNDFTLPLGTLGAILERREEHLTTDADFATTQREYQFGSPASTSFATTRLRCRRTCAATIRASTAARRRAG